MTTPRRAWWDHPATVIAVMILSTVPLWATPIPPLNDLIGHMGRYHIQLHLADSPALQRNWAFHWHLIGNLGVDLLMEPLGRTLGVERGAWIIAAALPPLMISGIVRLGRLVHGDLSPIWLAAAPFALAYPYQFGFVNYWLGAGLAFHAAASWFTRTPRRADPLILALASMLLWVVHIYGWAIFAVIVAMRSLGVSTSFRPKALAQLALSLSPLAAPILLMLGQHGAAVRTTGWFDWEYKWRLLTWTLRDQNIWLDKGMLIAAGLTLLIAWWPLRLRFDRGLALVALALLALIALLPYRLLGSAYADVRLWPIFSIIALMAWGNTPRLARHNWLAGGWLVLFVIRVAASYQGYMEYSSVFSERIAAFGALGPGARVAAFTPVTCDTHWRRPRTEHLDALAIIRRDAFTNGQWAMAGGQLLEPLAAQGSRFNADPSELLGVRECTGELRAELASTIAALPPGGFDYVWINGFAPATLPDYAGLTPISAGKDSILYRINRPK